MQHTQVLKQPECMYVCMHLEDRVPAEFTYLPTYRQKGRRAERHVRSEGGRQKDSTHALIDRQTD